MHALQIRSEECRESTTSKADCVAYEAPAAQDGTDTDAPSFSMGGHYQQVTVRKQNGVIVAINCCNRLAVSDLISQLDLGSAARIGPEREILVFHGTRRFLEDAMLSPGLDAGCFFEIHEWLDGGGGGCSRIGVDEDVRQHESNRTMVQHNKATVVAPVSITPSHEESLLATISTSAPEGMYYITSIYCLSRFTSTCRFLSWRT
jgi:hypothetical protein